jgi:hypothetical protein
MMKPTWNKAKKDIFEGDAQQAFLFNFSEVESPDYLFGNSEIVCGQEELPFFNENFKIMTSKNIEYGEEHFNEYLKSFDEFNYSQYDFSLNLKDEKGEGHFSSVRKCQDTTNIKTLQKNEEDSFQDGSFNPCSFKLPKVQKESSVIEDKKVS